MRNVNEALRKTIGMEFMKRATRMPSRLRKMRNWNLWMGQALQS
jgi:hypothetical protein